MGDRPTLCRADDSRLVVIDIQERLAGVMEPADRARVLARTEALIQGAALLDVPVIATEQYPKGLGRTEETVSRHFPAGTPVVEKTCFACGRSEGFREALAADDRPQLVLAGMEAHVCVLQTALEAQAEGYQVYVAADAVCSRSVENYYNALARLRQAGVVVANSESVLFEWVGDAGHERFKAVSALVK